MNLADGWKTDDIQTVQAFRLARKADPDGERTIGKCFRLHIRLLIDQWDRSGGHKARSVARWLDGAAR